MALERFQQSLLGALIKTATDRWLDRSDREFKRRRKEVKRRALKLAAYVLEHGRYDFDISGSGMSPFNRGFDRYLVDSPQNETGERVRLEVTDRSFLLRGQKRDLRRLMRKGSRHDEFAINYWATPASNIGVKFDIHGGRPVISWIDTKEESKDYDIPYADYRQGRFDDLPRQDQMVLLTGTTVILDKAEKLLGLSATLPQLTAGNGPPITFELT